MTIEQILSEFREKFANAFKWVELNCSAEIITGIDLAHFLSTIESFLTSSLTSFGKSEYERGIKTEHERGTQEIADAIEMAKVGWIEEGKKASDIAWKKAVAEYGGMGMEEMVAALKADS